MAMVESRLAAVEFFYITICQKERNLYFLTCDMTGVLMF